MRILWVKSDFLHPTTKGGHIRTLEMLRRLHHRHELHYVAFDNGAGAEDIGRSRDYCSHAYPIPFTLSTKGSARFYWDVLSTVGSSLPVNMLRMGSALMRHKVDELVSRHRFDALICDFLAPSINLPSLEKWVLFQHNVETQIWQRHAETAGPGAKGWYLRSQAERMFAYERDVCRRVRQVIAVSDADARMFRTTFHAKSVSAIPTGVDVDYFSPPASAPATSDLVFVGSMDWEPNVDGMLFFAKEILPLIRRALPTCSVSIVGRDPTRRIKDLAERDPLVRVVGTVPDVRPYLWSSKVAIVPLRIGGGTRLKIYEAMADRVPVVSTAIGAEGLDVVDGETIRLADAPAEFAKRCIELLNSDEKRRSIAAAGWAVVNDRFSWEQVARAFESALASPAGEGPKRPLSRELVSANHRG